MVGLFGRFQTDSEKNENVKKIKELRKLVRSKKYSEALKVGAKYLQKVPENHDVQFIVGSIHYMKGRHREAISFFDKALEIGSYDVDVLILKANSHHILGENKRAVQCCDKIAEIDPKNKAVSELLSKLNLRD